MCWSVFVCWVLPSIRALAADRDVKGVSACVFSAVVITRATVHRWNARDALCCNVQQKLDGLTMTWQLLPDLMISLGRVHPPSFLSFCCLFASLSVAPSVWLKGSMFIEGCTHLLVLRQETAIYRLLSARWKAHKLPLWKRFPQQQHFVSVGGRKRDSGWKREWIAGCEIRGTGEANLQVRVGNKEHKRLWLDREEGGHELDFAEWPTQNAVT